LWENVIDLNIRIEEGKSAPKALAAVGHVDDVSFIQRKLMFRHRVAISLGKSKISNRIFGIVRH
jgi:hypothetical protein